MKRLLCLLLALPASAATIVVDGRDAAALNAAIARAAAGDTVSLPAGDYTLEAPVALKSELKVIGAGQDRTRLVWGREEAGVFFALNGLHDLELAHLTLDGQLNPKVTQGIGGSRSQRLYLHHLTIRDLINSGGWGPHGILFSGHNPSCEGGVTDSVISDCRFENIGVGAKYGGGIRLAWGSERNQILRNTIATTGRGGIFGDHSDELIIRENTVTGSGVGGGEGLGIEIWGGCRRSLIEDNTVDHWLSCDGGDQSAIRRNTVGTADGSLKGYGIEVIARDVIVAGNTLTGGNFIGLSVSNRRVKNNVLWADNTVSQCAQWGAQFQGETGGIAHHYLLRCVFEQTIRGHEKARYPQDSGHGFRTNGACRGLVFDGCEFRANGGYGVQLGGQGVDRVEFRDCRFTDNGAVPCTNPAGATALEFNRVTVTAPQAVALPPARSFATPSPTAAFDAPETLVAGRPATFICRSTAAGAIVDRLWDFGVGLPEMTPEATVTFTRPGEQRVRLVVWDEHGRGAIVERTLTVAAP